MKKRFVMLFTLCLALMLFTGAGLQAAEASLWNVDLFPNDAVTSAGDFPAVIPNGDDATTLPFTVTTADDPNTPLELVVEKVHCNSCQSDLNVTIKVPVFTDKIVVHSENKLMIMNEHKYDYYDKTGTDVTLDLSNRTSNFYGLFWDWSNFHHLYIEYFAAPDAPQFNVKVADTENGTVTAEPTSIAAGLEVALTVTPDKGYMLDKITASDAEGNAVTISDNKFVMPKSDVTINATFKEMPHINYTVKSDITAAPGETVNVPVTVDSNYGAQAIKIALYFEADDPTLSVGAPTRGKDISSSEFEIREDLSGNGRIIYSCLNMFNGYKIPGGEIAVIPVTVAANASAGSHEIRISSVEYEYNSIGPDFNVPYEQSITAGTVNVVIDGADPIALDAPVLEQTNADAKNTMLVMTGVENSKQAENAEIQYRCSDDNGESWSAWQNDNVITGLDDGATYQVQARYGTPDNKVWKNSAPSNAITVSTGEGIAIEYVVGKVKGVRGKSVWVPVMISSNCPSDWQQPYQCSNIALDYSVDGLVLPEVSIPDYGSSNPDLSGASVILGTEPDGPFWRPKKDDSAPNGWSLGYTYGATAPPSCHLVSIRVDIPEDADLKTYDFSLTAKHSWEYSWELQGYVTEGKDYVCNYVNGSVEVVDNAEFPSLDAPKITEANTDEDYIEVTPPVSSQDPDATIEYAFSADNGATWFAWQESNVFYPANPDSNYCVRARYITSDPLTWNDSANSTIFQVKTKEAFKAEVTLTYNEQKTITAKRGEEVKIPVVLEHNFGENHKVYEADIGSWVNTGDDDENIDLTDGELGSAVSDDIFMSVQNHPVYSTYEFVCMYYFKDAALPQGEYAVITAKISDTADAGSYKIGMDPSQKENYSPATRFCYKHKYGGFMYYDVTYTNNYCTVVVPDPLAAPVLTAENVLADDTSITVNAPASAQDSNATLQYAISSDGEEWSDWQDSNVFSDLEAETEYQVRARYISSADANYDNSYAGEALKVSTVNPIVAYTVGSVEGNMNEMIQVPVSIDHNIAKQLTGFTVMINAADGLTLEGASAGSALAGDDWKVICLNDAVQVYKEGNIPFDMPKEEVLLLSFSADKAGEYAVGLGEVFGEDGNSFLIGEGAIHVNGTVTAGKVTVNDPDALAAEAVDALIDAIGTVTLESKDAIVAARTAYDALSDEQKLLVEKVDVLLEAEDALAALEKDAADKAAAAAVDELIRAIGDVTVDSKAAIDAARSAYDALTDEQQALVCDIDVLIAAEAAYEELTKPVVPIDPVEPVKPIVFADVKASDWYYEAVQYVAQNGLMEGMENNEFSPATDTTRGQLVTILYRMEGEPGVEGLRNPFTDLTQSWYKDAVIWAAEHEIVKGITETTYAPEDAVTREQVATILYRYAVYKGYDVSGSASLNRFPDAPQTSDYAKTALSWAVSEGLVNGTVINGKTLLDPQGTAIRAQLAALLQRFCEDVVK